MAKKNPKFSYAVRCLYATLRQHNLSQDDVKTICDDFHTRHYEDDSFDAPAKSVIAFFDRLGDYAEQDEKEEDALAHAGWTIECQSPLEIRHKDGDFATGQAARLVIDHVCRQ